ncbi:DUF3429 domain-containing protein [Legionella maceachernii]|uniref:DUF3429 domain-containing protein n=1 Tax=Legionella maceachernii TaxID=466 RepID=UPI00099B21AC
MVTGTGKNNGKKKSLATCLSYLGVLPFIITAYCLLLDIHQLPYLGDIHYVFYSYATLIASFMAGTHWGLAINSNSDHILILIISVTVVLILWVLWSSCQLSYCSIFLLPIYVLLWSIDFFFIKR